MKTKTIDQLMLEAAARAEEVYEKQTAGDSTQLGLLMQFMLELEKNGHIEFTKKAS